SAAHGVDVHAQKATHCVAPQEVAGTARRGLRLPAPRRFRGQWPETVRCSFALFTADWPGPWVASLAWCRAGRGWELHHCRNWLESLPCQAPWAELTRPSTVLMRCSIAPAWPISA